MKTFDELVKKEDRDYIKLYIARSMTDHISITNNAISPIDFLIVFVNKIKQIYIQDTTCNGICAAKADAFNNIRFDKNYVDVHISTAILCKFFEKDLAYDYVPTKFEWTPIASVEKGYWWTIRYGQRDSKSMARCVKPRLMFLDWLIDVLTAYKNEYVDI